VAFEVEEILSEHSGAMAPFDFFGTASSIERSLARDPTAANFDPPEAEHWRAVAGELRRRGMRNGAA